MYEAYGGIHDDPAVGASAAASGYRHAGYAESLSEWGVPRHLPRSESWILERPIADGCAHDGRGPYPLFVCNDWRALPDDLHALGQTLVSVTVVTDPFGAYDTEVLRRAFPDVVRPFKEHFVVDLTRPSTASSHHRRNARRARAAVAVERLAEPARHAGEWSALYETLARRHAIRGMATFSRRAFGAQLRVPGLVGFRARERSTTVGMTLWYVQDGVAYYHLGAYSERGYDLGASFALFDVALRELGGVADWASLGGAAGVHAAADDGLARFKAGWSTGTRTAWLCGRILAADAYAELTAARAVPAAAYFPAYRHGEPW